MAIANSSVRSAATSALQLRSGRSLLAAGLLGLLALLSLLGAIFGRIIFADEAAQQGGVVVAGFWDALFRGHDVAAIAQYMVMILAVLSLQVVDVRGVARQNDLGAKIGAAAFGVAALLLALVFLTKASDMLYMLPQGVAGAWLIRTNWLGGSTFGRRLRILGIISGVGLVVVAVSVIGVGVALGPAMMAIIGPIPTQVDAAAEQSVLNIVSHVFLMLGTFGGVLTFPIWAILVGRKLLADAASPS